MTDQKIKIRLPYPRQKLQVLFPEDVRGDIRIVFGKKTFKLQKAFLRLQSGFFKRAFSQAGQILQINQDFDQNNFSNILKCFYGFTIEINRSEILDYYPIIIYLEIQSLLRVVKEDINNKAENYDVFILLQIAHRFSEQEIFEVCLSLLEKEGYQQLRYAKHELLKCPMELFKIIIKTHNRLKAQKGLGIQFTEIDQLIKQFSEQKKLDETQYQQLKFELIDKQSLNSQEYKQIFLDDVKRKKNSLEYQSMIKLQPDSIGLYNSGFNNNLSTAGKLTQSVIEPMKMINDELTLELQNTYQKKKNQELQAQNSYLSAELNELRTKSEQHSASIDALKELVSRLKGRLEEKDRIDKQQSSIIKRLEKACLDLKTQVTTRNETIKRLQQRLLKLEKQPQRRPGNPKYIPYQEQEEELKTIQSQIVPGHMLKQMTKPAAGTLNPSMEAFKKSKKDTPVVADVEVEEQLDEEDIEEMYCSRLEFDRQPLGCNKRFLPKLANFLTNDGFQKQKLYLVFRRNTTNQEIFGQPNDIRNKKSLLILICTKLNQVIGGFTSIEITKNSNAYLSDENAFIFSLTKNEKFSIKASHVGEAIFISPQYLMGFSNDIMISIDCIKTHCECSWPDAFQSNGESRSPKWLTGQQSSFSIKSLQVYEVKEEEMIMDL